MIFTHSHWRCLVGSVAVLLAASGCDDKLVDPSLNKPIPFEPDRPQIGDPVVATPYMGQDPDVLQAQQGLARGLELHAKVIHRTCSPTGGVCHNNKEYPDLHTSANFLATLGAPCNVQPGTPEAVFDGCERTGDRLGIGDQRAVEIGYIEHIPGETQTGKDVTYDASSPGLHVYLADPLSTERAEQYTTGRFVRTFVNTRGIVEDLTFASFETRWWILDGGKHVLGQVSGGNSADRVQELLTVGIVQGDMNRNGTFGARAGDTISLLHPGKPEESYLIARLRGVMADQPVPGSRMPLANQPLSVPEMLALFCFVEGIAQQPQPYNLASSIDYANCSYSKNPQSLNLLGAGVTWKQRVKAVLDANCSGCHSGVEPQGGLDLKDGNVYARLLQPSAQKPGMNLITPGKPLESYLWLKLIGDKAIVGARMPFNPLTGEGKLTDAELADIEMWITAGAVENE